MCAENCKSVEPSAPPCFVSYLLGLLQMIASEEMRPLGTGIALAPANSILSLRVRLTEEY